MSRFIFSILMLGLMATMPLKAQSYYFPPLTGNTWATTDAASLGWNTTLIDELYDFLEEQDTKAFMVLKDGRIVMEQYFGTFTQDSLWYWASAGKSLTSFMVGMAKDQGFIDIMAPTSTYLGQGWTSLTPAQEAAITVRHQLTMTTGLDDGVSDVDCTDPNCLQYLAAPGTRWAYHNAPYTLLDEVMEAATGQALNAFFTNNVRSRTGMVGFWLPVGYNNVFFSKARTMARFGSLMLNKGIWNGDTLLRDQAYYTAMITPSQALNPSYGYLWWLNGQTSFKLPSSQLTFPGPLIPTGPADMYCALGKNDQKLYVIPSQKLVVVRLGNPAGDDLNLVPITFDRDLWERLSAIISPTTALEDDQADLMTPVLTVFPSPVREELNLKYTGPEPSYIKIWNTRGELVQEQTFGSKITVGQLPQGLYIISLHSGNGSYLARKMWLKV